MSSPEELTVELYAPGSGTPLDLSARVVNLVFGTSAPGGDADCSFEIHDAGTLPNPHVDAWIRPGSKVVIRDDAGTVYGGRIEVVNGDYRTSYARLSLLARGFASSAEDQRYKLRKVWPQGYPVGSIFIETTQDLCPDISAGGVSPGVGGRNLPETSQDFILSSAKQIWDTVAPLGGDETPLLYRVFCDGASTTPSLHVEARPSTPAVYAAMGAGGVNVPVVGIVATPGGTQVSMGADLRTVYNEVAVKYPDPTKAAGYAVITTFDSGSQGSTTGIDATRTLGLDLSSMNEVELSEATQAAHALLSQVASIENSGRQITMDYPQVGIDEDGNPVPLWRIRAGSVIRVTDYFSGDQTAALDQDFYIVQSTWTERARRLTLSVGRIHGMTEGIGKSLRKKRPARSDPELGDPVPEAGREPTRGWVSTKQPSRGSSNHAAPYSPADHDHGTVDGSIAATYGLDGAGSAIVAPAETAIGLIRGTMESWLVRTNPEGVISYLLEFPEAQVTVRERINAPEEVINLPGGQVVITDATDTQSGPINIECASHTEVRISVTGTPTATWAALVLRGTRNLIFSEPLTPIEAGTGAEA
jgi:hypothetical protein